MTIDERIEKLTERHEALAGTVELLTADIQALAARDAARQEEMAKHQLAILTAIQAYMQALNRQ